MRVSAWTGRAISFIVSVMMMSSVMKFVVTTVTFRHIVSTQSLNTTGSFLSLHPAFLGTQAQLIVMFVVLSSMVVLCMVVVRCPVDVLVPT